MSKRAEHRRRYIEGWDTMDAGKLLSSVTEDFVFDDPDDPEPVTRAALVDYMPRWPEKARALGGRFEFEMTDKVVEDKDGVLLEWYWWKLAGTDIEGTALIKTTDEGVVYEKLAYYRAP